MGLILRTTGPEQGIDKLRVGVVSGTIALTALVYSTNLASFSHAKLFALACAVGLLGILMPLSRQFVRRSALLFLLVVMMIDLIGRASIHLFDVSARFVPQSGLTPTYELVYVLLLFAAMSADLFSVESNRRSTMNAICITGGIAAALAIGQYAGLLPFLFPEFAGASPVYSVFGNPGLLGGYLAVALPLTLSNFLDRRGARPIVLTGAALMTFALLLSGARSAWIAAGVGCAVAVWRNPRVRDVAIAAGALFAASVLCVILAPEATLVKAAQTFSQADAGGRLRLWFWAGTWEIIKGHPFVGVGLGRFAQVSPIGMANVLWAPGGERFAHNTLLVEHPHNDFLSIWAEAGILGVALCAWLLVRLLKCRGPEWGGLAGFFVFALFNCPLQSPPHALVFAVLVLSILESNGRSEAGADHAGSWVKYAVSLIALCMPLLVGYSIIVPSYWLQQAQSAHIAGIPSVPIYQRALGSKGALSAETHEKCGVAYLDAKAFDEAREQFRLALKSGDSGSLYLGMGTAEYLLGHQTAAYRALEQAVYRWPSHLDAWRLLLRTCDAASRDGWLSKAKRFLNTRDWEALKQETSPKMSSHTSERRGGVEPLLHQVPSVRRQENAAAADNIRGVFRRRDPERIQDAGPDVGGNPVFAGAWHANSRLAQGQIDQNLFGGVFRGDFNHHAAAHLIEPSRIGGRPFHCASAASSWRGVKRNCVGRLEGRHRLIIGHDGGQLGDGPNACDGNKTRDAAKQGECAV